MWQPDAGDLLTLSGYVVGVAVYFVAGRSHRSAHGIDSPTRLKLLVAALVGGMLGAKVVQWTLLGFPSTATGTGILDPASGGRTIIAGLLCGWIAVELTKWRLGIRQSSGDMFALAIPAGEAVGRLGCHLNQCCYGAVVAAGTPLAVYQHGEWRLPAQLIASGLALLILLALLLLRRWRALLPGDLFRSFLLLFGAGRFCLEFIRARETLYFGLSLAQWVSLELMLVGIATLVLPRMLTKARKTQYNPQRG
jgi:phosphatidylglycerol:prolipoprotein diacylglycerol transferase